MSYRERAVEVPLGMLVVIASIVIEITLMTLPYFSCEDLYIYPIDDPWIFIVILISMGLSLTSIVLLHKGVDPVPLILLSVVIDILSIIYVIVGSKGYITPQLGLYLTIIVASLKSVACLLIKLRVGEVEFRIIEKPTEYSERLTRLEPSS